MIARGLLLLARGRSDGIKEFGNTGDAVAASLAPLIAFPLVGAGWTALNGDVKFAALGFFSRLCGVLALPLITYEFARLSRRGADWLRTVAALNWSFWMLLPALLAAAALGAMAVAAGVPQTTAEQSALTLLILYILWYQWFIIRVGLRLGVVGAVLLVVLNSAAISLFSAAPLLLDQLDRMLAR